MHDDLSDESQLHHIIEHILEYDAMDTDQKRNAAGVARQVLGQGWGSLSVAQQEIFNRVLGHRIKVIQSKLEAEYRADLLSKDAPP